MEALEVVDDDVMPWFNLGFAGLLSNRPITTEADLIAAAAPIGEVEIRFMIDDLPDDPAWRGHAKRSCSICALGGSEYVLDQKQQEDEELRYFGVEWDPTITF